VHVPALQTSGPLQNTPSLHGLPLVSGPVHASLASLHDSAQLPSPSAPGHGLPACDVHAPALHVSLPLQYRPSLHGAVLPV